MKVFILHLDHANGQVETLNVYASMIKAHAGAHQFMGTHGDTHKFEQEGHTLWAAYDKKTDKLAGHYRITDHDLLSDTVAQVYLAKFNNSVIGVFADQEEAQTFLTEYCTRYAATPMQRTEETYGFRLVNDTETASVTSYPVNFPPSVYVVTSFDFADNCESFTEGIHGLHTTMTGALNKVKQLKNCVGIEYKEDKEPRDGYIMSWSTDDGDSYIFIKQQEVNA